jgi:hypothetical protein
MQRSVGETRFGAFPRGIDSEVNPDTIQKGIAAMNTPLNVRLLNQVLTAAEEQGLGQAQPAERAGLKPETVSRAKKRSDMALGTLESLANAVGLQVVLQPSTLVKQRQKASAGAALAQPRFGLAWSNRKADESVLLRNALVQGRFDAIVESAVKDGMPFVRSELQHLRSSGAITASAAAKVDAMLASIDRGFAKADSNAATA